MRSLKSSWLISYFLLAIVMKHLQFSHPISGCSLASPKVGLRRNVFPTANTPGFAEDRRTGISRDFLECPFPCCTDSVLQVQLGNPANMAVLIGNLTGFRCSKLVKLMQCDRIWYHMNSAYYFDGCFSRWDFSRQSRSILPQKRLKWLAGCLLYRLRGHSATCNDCNPRVRASAVTTQPVIWEFFIVIVLYSLSRMQVSSIFRLRRKHTHTHVW